MLFCKTTKYCLGMIVLVAVFASQSDAQMYKVYWKNLQLTSASGVPDGRVHTYRMSGTFLVTDAETTSWTDSVPLLNAGGDPFVTAREEVFMEVTAIWNSETNQAVESIRLTYEGGVQGELKSSFKSTVDPFLTGARCVVENSQIECEAENIEVPMGNGLTTERYPYFDLTALVRGGQHPLTGGRVNKQKATQLSTESNSGTTPPPPAVPTTKLRVAGDWQSSIGKFNLEQNGNRVLGTCLNDRGEVFLVKGEIANERMQLSLSTSGTVQLVMEGLTPDTNQSRFNGRYRRPGGRAGGLASTITLTRKLNIIVMNPTNSGGQAGTVGNGTGGVGNPAGVNLSGNWNSNLGSVKFTQEGKTVRGELTFANGLTAVLNGTVEGRDYNFQWGVGGQTLGTGHLYYKNDNRTLDGTYTDNRIGQPSPFKLDRQ